MAKRNLLLVDADPRSVRVLEVSLRKAGYSVTTSSSVADALELVQLTEPDMVVSDTQLEGQDGFDFIRAFKKESRLAKIPFVFLSRDASVENKVRGLELGADEYLTKPVYIREILARIQLIFQRQEQEGVLRTTKTRFAGPLADMGLVDLLQTIDVSRKSGVLHLRSGTRSGAVYFRDGRLVDAELGSLRGEAAVYRFLVWSDGEFEVDFRDVDREDRIQVSTQGILMEGMRRLDEWGRLQEQLPVLDTVFQVNHDELVQRLAEIPDEINDVLKLFDGRRSLTDVVDAAQGDDLATLNAITKLYFEGFVAQGLRDVVVEESELVLGDSLSAPAPVLPPAAKLPPSVSPDAELPTSVGHRGGLGNTLPGPPPLPSRADQLKRRATSGLAAELDSERPSALELLSEPAPAPQLSKEGVDLDSPLADLQARSAEKSAPLASPQAGKAALRPPKPATSSLIPPPPPDPAGLASKADLTLERQIGVESSASGGSSAGFGPPNDPKLGMKEKGGHPDRRPVTDALGTPSDTVVDRTKGAMSKRARRKDKKARRSTRPAAHSGRHETKASRPATESRQSDRGAQRPSGASPDSNVIRFPGGASRGRRSGAGDVTSAEPGSTQAESAAELALPEPATVDPSPQDEAFGDDAVETFFSSRPPAPAASTDGWAELTGGHTALDDFAHGRARRVTLWMIASALVLIGGFLLYHKVLMPTPEPLGVGNVALPTPAALVSKPKEAIVDSVPGLDVEDTPAIEVEPSVPSASDEPKVPSEPALAGSDTELEQVVVAPLAEVEPAPEPSGSDDGEQPAATAAAEPAPLEAAGVDQESAPSPATGYASLVKKARRMGYGKRARSSFEQALEANPQGDDALSGLAMLLLNQGRNRQASERAQQAVELNSRNSEAWIVLGAARDALGQKTAAREAYRQCVEKGQGEFVRECRRMLR